MDDTPSIDESGPGAGVAGMRVTVEEIGPCRKRVRVVVLVERVREEYDAQYEEINEHVTLPGFRPGKAPRKVLERRFAARLAPEVRERLVKSSLERLGEEGVRLLEPPDLDLEAIPVSADAPVEFAFEAVTKPDFALPSYEGREVKVPPVVVPDEDVEEAIMGLRRRRGKLDTEPDAVIAPGDVLVVDWVARSGGSEVAKDEGFWHPVDREVLAGMRIPDLAERLRGRKAGVEETFAATGDEDAPNEDVRGRPLEVTVKVNEVKRYAPAPVEELLETNDWDDEEEMKAEVRKSITRLRRREVERLAEERLIESLLSEVDMPLPDSIVEREMERANRRERGELAEQGMDEEEVERRLQDPKGTAATHESVTRDMKRWFLMDRLADAEGIEVTQTELGDAIEQIASAYMQPVDAVIESFRDPARLADLRAQVRHEKVRARLREKASIVEEAADAPAAK